MTEQTPLAKTASSEVDMHRLKHLADAQNLDIPATSETTVLAHYNTAARMADLLSTAPLDKNQAELMPVFCPPKKIAEDRTE